MVFFFLKRIDFEIVVLIRGSFVRRFVVIFGGMIIDLLEEDFKIIFFFWLNFYKEKNVWILFFRRKLVYDYLGFKVISLITYLIVINICI